MKRPIMLIIVLFFLTLFIPYVNAAIEVGEEASKNIILPGEAGEYYLDISNPGGKDSFGIITNDNNWRIKGKTSLEMEAGQKQRIRLEILPIGELKSGSYSVNVRVYSKTSGEAVDKALLINLVAFNELVDAQLEYNPQGLDPRKENLVKLNLKNKNNIKLEDVRIKIESSLFNDERVVDLLPLEARVEELKVSFSELVEKGSYEVKLLITMQNQVLVERVEKVNVGYYSDVTQDKSVEDGFLVKNTFLFWENKGNTASEEEFSLRLNSFEKTFTSIQPEPSEKSSKNNLYYYTWRFTINPGDDYRIEIKTDYLTPLIVIIILIVGGIVIYYLVKKDVAIKKKVLTIKSNQGISEMKVILIVTNKGGSLKHVQVMDKLPKIVKSPAEYGVVKPSHVRHNELGDAIITWDLQNLVRNEERVISYKVKAAVQVIGRMSMPMAIAKYRTKSGKLITVNSNKYTI